MKTLLFSFLVIFSLSNIDKCDRGNHEDHNYANLGEKLDLTLNENIAIKAENLSISFEKMADSRCPTGVNCIRAGEAKVTLKVTKDDQEETLEMEAKGMCESDDGSCGEEKATFGYTIKLINVYPYPTEPKSSDEPKAYAKLVVSK